MTRLLKGLRADAGAPIFALGFTALALTAFKWGPWLKAVLQ